MNKKTLFKRIALASLLAIIVTSVIFVRSGETKAQPYYSGDAINYRGQLVFATANSGYLEIFKLNGTTVETLVKQKVYNDRFNSYDDYSDVRLLVENGNLYVYATSEYTVFKYNFSELNSLELIKKAKNSYWEWYNQIDKLGNSLVTVSNKGIKVLDANLEVIDAYNFTGVDSYSVTSNGDNNHVLGISDSGLKVYERANRLITKEIPLNFTSKENNHKAYLDVTGNSIYAVDDYYAKKFDATTGQLLASFRHLDAAGYDMESSSGNDYVYFSNGLGVVKLNKDTFKVADFAYTSMIAGPQGWAMGLKLVSTDNGDVLVVFNGSNIVLLDKKLDKIVSVKAIEVPDQKPQENLYLNVSSNSAIIGSQLSLSGGGFLSSENLQILLGNTEIVSLPSDKNGRFDTMITIPETLKGKKDIKVTGLGSKRTYSVSFEVK